MGDEAPHVQDAIITLLQRWGQEPWLLDAKQVSDDAGLRLEVRVVAGLYTKDVLPRRIVTRQGWEDSESICYVIVRQVPDPLTRSTAQKLLEALP